MLALFGWAGRASAAPPFSSEWSSYQSIPLGERTAVMGGAAAAYGSDGAMPLLNPAGIALIDASHISASATGYSLHALTVDHYFTSGTPDPTFANLGLSPVETYHSQVFEAFPTNIMYSFPGGAPAGQNGHWVLALSFSNPRRWHDAIVGRFDISATSGTISALEFKNRETYAYYLGPSFGLQIDTWLRLGVSAMVLYQPFFSSFSSTTRNLSGAEFSQDSLGSVATGSSYDGVAIVGLQADITPKFHAGASFGSPSLHFAGGVRQDVTGEHFGSMGMLMDNGTETNIVRGVAQTDSFKIAAPLHAVVGLSYEEPKSWAIAVDVHYYGTLDYQRLHAHRVTNTLTPSMGNQIVTETQDQTAHGNAVIDVNVGAEVYLSETMALRAGFFTDFSPSPDIVVDPNGVQIDNQKVDQFGATLGLAFFFGPTDLTVGAAYVGGTGKYGASKNLIGPPNDANYQVSNATESRLMLIITGGVNLGILSGT